MISRRTRHRNMASIERQYETAYLLEPLFLLPSWAHFREKRSPTDRPWMESTSNHPLLPFSSLHPLPQRCYFTALGELARFARCKNLLPSSYLIRINAESRVTASNVFTRDETSVIWSWRIVDGNERRSLLLSGAECRLSRWKPSANFSLLPLFFSVTLCPALYRVD